MNAAKLTADAHGEIYQQAMKVDRAPVSSGDKMIFSAEWGTRLVLGDDGTIEVWKDGEQLEDIRTFFVPPYRTVERRRKLTKRRFSTRLDNILAELEREGGAE